uniref:DNA-directed DNA polymerase n=1 Tax=Phylloscopus densovirus TaxID=2794543 RepID=A0A8A4XEE1_9VIRU|nr:MAG: PolB [Phylloscopus densovirus]
MALRGNVRPITETTQPQFAYYRATSRELFAKFLESAIRRFTSCTLSIHVQYVFYKSSFDDFVEAHSAPMRTDIDIDDCEVEEGRILRLINEAEVGATDDLAGSGYTMADIKSYYVNILPYCLMPEGITPTQYNTVSTTRNDMGRKSTIPRVGANSFIGALCIGFMAATGGPKIQKPRQLLQSQAEKFVKAFKLQSYVGKDINLSNVVNAHDRIDEFNLIVINERGHIVYRRSFTLESEEEENEVGNYIVLLWKNAKWYYIKSVKALFGTSRKTRQQFCIKCNFCHDNMERCGKPKEIPMKFMIKEQPSEPRHLVGYADFEAYIDHETLEHRLSGYSVCYTKREDKKAYIWAHRVTNLYNEDLTDAEPDVATHDLMKNFFDHINEFIRDYHDGISVDSPPICCAPGDYHSTSTWVFNSYNTGQPVTYCGYHLIRSDEKLVIYFHNFKGYDSNFIVQYAIANNYECNIFTRRAAKVDQFLITHKENPFIRFEFRDSFNHLASPLGALADTIENWINMPKRYKEAFESNKGPFPYDWFDDPHKLEDDIPREKAQWFNKLSQTTHPYWREAIRYFDQQEWTQFHQYHDFYNLLDTYLLAVVFEQYRSTVLTEDNIDPTYFFGVPSLSLYTAVKANPTKYVAPPTAGLYHLLQKNIRGGVSQVLYRYAEKTENNYIKYLDVNALYSSCMMERLPTEFISFIEGYWDRRGSEKYSSEEFTSIFLIDKITYPRELHDKPEHFQYPLCPHHYQGKLCTTFLEKEKYLMHEDNFNFYKEKGLVMEDILATYIFKYEYVMRNYIKTNIDKRNLASTPKPIKDLCKLKNNALFGKTCENVWKYKKIGINVVPDGSSDEEIKAFSRKFKKAQEIQYITPMKVVYGEAYSHVKLCKPIQLGFVILERAKLKVYQFIHKIFEIYGERIQLLYTDTDSLIILFKNFNRDPYYDLNLTMPHLIDVPIVNGKFVKATKEPGKWSDDSSYKVIVKYCGLRAKSYALLFDDDTDSIKNKGIIKSAQINNNKINFNHFRAALVHDQKFVAQQQIIFRRHRTYVLESRLQNKLAINTYDSKHMYARDKRTAVPFGYLGDKFSQLHYIISDFTSDKIHL